jgi:uncharacterized protein with predicted RNA binding PUA domain
MNLDIKRVRAIADYQLGSGIGKALFPENVSFEYSKRTGKIRFIFHNGTLISALRPTDGLLTLTIAGAEILVNSPSSYRFAVTIQDDVAEVIVKGRNVMAKHVVKANTDIKPKDEVIVLNSKKEVLAVGRALLTGEEMLAFQTGVAVKTRRGRERDR